MSITVNCVNPGPVHTAILPIPLEEFKAASEPLCPNRRPQSPADIGRAVVFLASQPNITAQSLSVVSGVVLQSKDSICAAISSSKIRSFKVLENFLTQ